MAFSLKDWLAGETLFAADLKAYINDNLDYRLKPPAFYVYNTGTYTTASTSFVPVNAAFTQAMVTSGGAILCGVLAHVVPTTTGFPDLAIGMDGGSERVIYRRNAANTPTLARGIALFSGLSAGLHTPTLRWRNGSGGGATMRGADNAGVAIPPIIFWAIEI